MPAKARAFFVLISLLVITSHARSDDKSCSATSIKTIANSYITPFGLVTSPSTNGQWVGVLDCQNSGMYIEHTHRLNGGRDNTIVGAFYRFQATDNLSVRFVLDHLDVDVPSIEVPRARAGVTYQGALTYSAEFFYFMDNTDQRLLLWTVSDTYSISDTQQWQWQVGGAYTTGFALQDRFFAQVDYTQAINNHWSWRALQLPASA